MPDNVQLFDRNARIELRHVLTKIRKLDRSIGKALKQLYDYRCQICCFSSVNPYGAAVAECHHISPFVKSLNNNPDNLMILCANHHRLCHASRALISHDRRQVIYRNGHTDNLQLVKHRFS